MKALILNSGIGSRMEDITSTHPKCMTEISSNETILSRQLRLIKAAGINDVIITTGYMADTLKDYCKNLDLELNIQFVHSEKFETTNYIYSMYLAKVLLDDDILLMHGDLVFDFDVLVRMLENENSCMKVSSSLDLPEKDFKAVVDNHRVKTVAIDVFDNAVEAQAFYKLNKSDMASWLEKIEEYVNAGNTNCYAENALNEITADTLIEPFDVKNQLCTEIDTPADLENVKAKLNIINKQKVYLCFSADVVHSAHIAMIKKAACYGHLIVGVMSDEAEATYRRLPLLPFEERKNLFKNIVGVDRVVEQKSLSYRDNIREFQPDIVIHGDDWKQGVQKTIREEVIEELNKYGGRLIEFPYSDDEKFQDIDRRMRLELSTPDIRRKSLKRLIDIKGTITAMEAHSGLTGLIVENTVVEEAGGAKQFDAMWISSLCDSTAKGKPDIELVDMTSRFRTIDDICEVTTKPIIFDGDTGGLTEHFVYTVRSLERMGVSMVIIEDKTGLKKNSLFGNEVVQKQASIEDFCEKIRAGKKAQRTSDFMICARIESLILEAGMEDALKRAFAFVGAGADAIMIHSRKKDPAEIIEFVKKFREKDSVTPIVVVPTSFNSVTEEEFKEIGVNVVIYANQLTRSAFPAMKKAAETILKNHRAMECDDMCMPFKEIIRLIPEE